VALASGELANGEDPSHPGKPSASCPTPLGSSVFTHRHVVSSASGSGGGRRIATLGDIANAGGGGPGGPPGRPSGGDDDDSDDEAPPGETLYAGGERSGLSVQNPGRNPETPNVPGGNLVRDLLRRAAEGGPPPEADPDVRRWGSGNTLGSDEIESAPVADPHAPPAREQETAIRHITFWRNGWSIEDGDLLRYDDEEHARILNEINDGRAPPAILNVLPGQPVELRVAKRVGEDYVTTARTFAGSGSRLGGVVPNIVGTPQTQSMPGTFNTGAPAQAPSQQSSSSTDEPSGFEVDQTLPTTSVQVRLADGTRLVARMNLTHTVGDIRKFIEA
jgi:UBX domain-containing protein 1